MNNISKAKKILIGFIILVVLIALVGITYAYFTANINGNEDATTITATSGNMKLAFDGGPGIESYDLAPGTVPFAIKTFTVTGTNTVGEKMGYDIYLIIDENTFSTNAISYTLEGTNIDSNGSLVPNITEREGLGTEDEFIGTGEFIGIVNNLVHSYTLKIYFYDTGENQIEDMDKTFRSHINIEEAKPRTNDYKIVDAANKITIDMNKNMIPVTYNASGQTIKSNTESGSWYNYNQYKWANAVLVTEASRNTYKKSSVGTVINATDILAYYVWIPRYRYTLWNINAAGNVGVAEKPITINFQLANETVYNGTTNGSELTHPAFWWDINDNNVRESGEELNGFWVGKFEVTGDPTTPTIKPNFPSMRTQIISKIWTTIEKFKTSSIYGINESLMNSHMMKNMEWGAVAYLSNSQYGNRVNPDSSGTEIFVNPSSSYITGRSGNAVNHEGITDTSGESSTDLYSWNGKACTSKTLFECTGAIQSIYGPSASTTGTIYGVYDMSGGANEYVMGNMNASGLDGTRTMNVCSAGTTFGSYTDTTLPKRYFDSYDYGTSYSDATAFMRGKLGDATREIIATVASIGAWNLDKSCFAYNSSSWIARGGHYGYTSTSGIWNFNSNYGTAFADYSGRAILIMTT